MEPHGADVGPGCRQIRQHKNTGDFAQMSLNFIFEIKCLFLEII